MLTQRLILLSIFLLFAGGLAMAQSDDAAPEPEGYQSMESVETENGEMTPEVVPEVADDPAQAGPADPEPEGYQSMESVETEDGEMAPEVAPAVPSETAEPADPELEGYQSKESVETGQ